MPGFLLHEGAAVTCFHSAPARATTPSQRVFVNGMPIVVQPVPFTVTGCPFNVSGAPSPCITAQWTTASVRVKSLGMPVLLFDSQATCVPNGTPVLITTTQTRVSAQ